MRTPGAASATAPAAVHASPARRELANAVLTLWLPVLVPLVTGMLRDSDHAFWSYVWMFPLVPGAIVPALLGLDGAWFFVAAGIAALTLFAGLWLALRALPPLLRGVLRAAVVFGVAFEAIGFANLLRA